MGNSVSFLSPTRLVDIVADSMNVSYSDYCKYRPASVGGTFRPREYVFTDSPRKGNCGHLLAL